MICTSSPTIVFCFHRTSKTGGETSNTLMLANARAEMAAARLLSGRDPFQLYYTSGTSGTPKAVLLSHDIVVRHALGCVEGALQAVFQMARRKRYGVAHTLALLNSRTL